METRAKDWLVLVGLAIMLYLVGFFIDPAPIALVKHPSGKCYKVMDETLTCEDYEKHPNKFKRQWVSQNIDKVN